MCETCGRTQQSHVEIFGRGLSVHHKSYARLGEELDTDLMALCEPCHAEREGIPTERERYDDETPRYDEDRPRGSAYLRSLSRRAQERKLETDRWLLDFVIACGTSGENSIPQHWQKALFREVLQLEELLADEPTNKKGADEGALVLR